MKSFKSYIAEARMTTVGEITAAIAGHKKAGEILNPEYQDLGSQHVVSLVVTPVTCRISC